MTSLETEVSLLSLQMALLRRATFGDTSLLADVDRTRCSAAEILFPTDPWRTLKPRLMG